MPKISEGGEIPYGLSYAYHPYKGLFSFTYRAVFLNLHVALLKVVISGLNSHVQYWPRTGGLREWYLPFCSPGTRLYR